MEIKGSAAVVTGGGSGLGAATVRRLAAAGVRVAVIDLDPARAGAVAAEVGGLACPADVGDAGQMEAAFAAAAAAHGPARLLVTCAGIAPPKKVVGRDGVMALGEFEKVIRVNLIGTFNAIRLAAGGMSGLEPAADGERGVIVATASIAAYEGQIGQSAYAASKGGVVGMTLPLAREFAALGIRMVSIAPGLFRTPLVESLPPEAQASLAAAVPYPKRLGEPAEFADLVVTIAACRYFNGETIRLDGALRMAPR